MSLFLPWYGLDFEFAGLGNGRLRINAFEAFNVLDAVLCVTAMLVLALVTGLGPLGVNRGRLLVATGVGVLVVVGYRALDTPVPTFNGVSEPRLEYGLEVGIWIALAAGLGMVLAGWRLTKPTGA